MDSILGDLFMQGRRVRPATLEYALANYPRIIVGIKLNKLYIDAVDACDARDLVTIWDRKSPVFRYVITRDDFDKCVLIAKQMTIPLFPSDIEQDWFDRAKAHIRNYFQ